MAEEGNANLTSSGFLQILSKINQSWWTVMVFNFKSGTFMLVVWRGIPRSIRWSIWWNSLWLTDFLALPRRGQRFLLEKVSRNDHSSFPLQGREMAGSSNFKLLMRLSHPFQIWDVFHYFNVHLSDIFTALVIAQEKLNVLRKAFNHWCHCKRWESTWTFWNLTNLRGITSSPSSCLVVRTISFK